MRRPHVHVGRRIRELRERMGISLKELSERTGLDHSFLREVELGRKSISERNLQRVAEALKTDPRNLFLQTELDVALLQREAMERLRRIKMRLEELGWLERDPQLEGLLELTLEEMGEVLQAIWVAIPIEVELEAELSRLTRTARRVARFLLEGADEEGRFSGPLAEIAMAVRRSKRAVSSGIKELEALGLISVERGGGRNRTNRYKVSDRLLRLWRER